VFNHIKIEGFRTFKHVELDLEPLSVLIGPNNSGKSNFLDLMSLMSEAGQGRLEDGVSTRGGFEGITTGFAPFGKILLEFHFEGASLPYYFPVLPVRERPDITFRLGLEPAFLGAGVSVEEVDEEPTSKRSHPITVMKRNKDDCIFASFNRETGLLAARSKTLESKSELAIFQVKDLHEYPTPYSVLRQFQEWSLYRDIDVRPETPIRQPALVRPAARLSPNAANLTSVLNSIQQKHPTVWEEIVELLHTAYPDFKTITFPPEGGDGKVVLRWWERPYDQGGVSANFLSDGTLKFLCMIAILKSPDPPPLICIDEPELGLHPDWIKLVAEMMQAAATRTQLIVATHSPQIVAGLEPEQVIVAEKENGETRLRRLQTEELGKWLNEFNLSDLWLAGHLGGRP
jgi:predicted ATPase